MELRQGRHGGVRKRAGTLVTYRYARASGRTPLGVTVKARDPLITLFLPPAAPPAPTVPPVQVTG